MRGCPRADGRKGIRNVIVVGYLVECAHHVAREIAIPLRDRRARHRLSRLLSQRLRRDDDGAPVHASQRRRGAAGLAGLRELRQIPTGESARCVRAAGAHHHHPGQRRHALGDRRGPRLRRRAPRRLDRPPTVSMDAAELVVGTVCGGSDGTSGMTGNPAAGRASTCWSRPAPPASSRKPAS